MGGGDDATGPDPGEEEAPLPGNKTWRASLMYDEVGDTRAMKAFKVLFPIAIWLGSFGFAHLVWPSSVASRWITLSIMYLIPPLGKESIIPLGVSEGYHPMVMALTVTFVDLVVAMLLSWNYYFLTKIPVAGKGLAYVESKGASTMDKHPSIKSGAWFALLGFVSIPGVGAGGFTGSIIGRMVGMRPYQVISAVGVGAMMSGLLYAYVADAIIRMFAEDFVLGLFVLLLVIQAIVAIVAIVLLMRWRSIRKWSRELEARTD